MTEQRLRRRDGSEAACIQVTSAFTETLLTLTISYLLHVLPDRFVRIRHFGFLANRVRSRNLALAREQLGVTVPEQVEPEQDGSVQRCPSCQVGLMMTIELIEPQPLQAIDSP